MDATTERHLIERARHDLEAFRALYRHYFPRVFAYAAYRVETRQEAEDVTAEVFLKMVQGLAAFEYRGEGSLAAWVFRIAHSAVGQYYRGQRAELVSLDDLPDIRSEDATPEEALVNKERFRRLREHIATLPPRQQEVVTLKFAAGLRNKEIAAALGLDERTVAAHLS